MKGPTKHLTWYELQCKDGTPYPDEWRDTRVVLLAEVFEVIRLECGGRPIEVLSGYRSPKHNRKIGGAHNSQHVQGRALDLKPPKGMNVLAFHNKIVELSKIIPIRGIGKYKTFVHVDIRPTSRVARWSSPQVKDSMT